MDRIAIYTRVSSQEQAREGVSLTDQKEQLELWAKSEGWEVTGHYSDEGVSGGTDNRIDLQRLMYDAKSGSFDLVAVTKIDRFMRNTRLLLNYIHDLKEAGVGFAAKAEGIDTRKPGLGDVIVPLLGSIAEWEKGRIGERVRDFRGHLAGKGQWSSGRTPFGYRFNKDNKELEIDELEADVIRYIFNTYLNDSLGIIRLAERLNTEQKLTPRWGHRKHNIWTQSAIRHVLTHFAYKGGPSEDWKFKCQAIVEPTTWYLVQKRLMTNRHFKPAKSQAEFQGLLRCGLCSHTLRIAYDHNTKRKYECPGRGKKLHLDGSLRCSLPRFSAEELETSLSKQIVATFSDTGVLRHHLDETLKSLNQEAKQLEHKLKPMHAEMERVREDMVIADTKLEMRRIDPDTYKAIIGGSQAKLRNLQRQRKEADPLVLQQYDANRIDTKLYQRLLDNLDRADMDKAGSEIIKAFVGSPREAMAKYGWTALVYPDRIQLKGTLSFADKVDTDAFLGGQSDVSSACRSARCRRFQ